MFRRWKWFRRRRRSASAAAAALRDDRLVREALDDYVRLTFSSGAASPAGAAGAASRTRCSVRRLPLDSAPRGQGRWSLDEQLLAGRRRSYAVFYVGTSPTPASSGSSQQAGFSCDCSEQSSCPHSGGRGTAGDQPPRAEGADDASAEAPPREPSSQWRPEEEGEPVQTSNDKAVQVDRSQFISSKSSQTDTPRKNVEEDEGAEEPNAERVRSKSVAPRKRSREEDDSDEPTAQESKSATPRKRSKGEVGTEEPTPRVARSQSAARRKSSTEEEDTDEPSAQVVRSESATPRKRSIEEEDSDEPTAREVKRKSSATPRKRSKEEEDSDELSAEKVRSKSVTPRKRSKEEDDSDEPTAREVKRKSSATPRKRSKEEDDSDEPTAREVKRKSSVTPRKRSKEDEDSDEPTARSQSATLRKRSTVVEEDAEAATARSRGRSRCQVVEAVTQTEEPPSQQTVVRLLPGPSGLPTIVIESTGSWQYGQSTSSVGVQVRNEHLVAAAGEAARSGRAGERRSKAALAGRGRQSRTRVEGQRGGKNGAQQQQQAAPQAEDPGAMRWADWDDRQSPWVATQKYSILNTTEESSDSILKESSSQNVDRRLAESEPPAAAAGAPGVVLSAAPPPAAAPAAPPAPASCPLTGCPAERRRRPCGAPTPPPTPPPTRPATPPGLHHPHLRRHDCIGQLQDPPSGRGCGGQSPR